MPATMRRNSRGRDDPFTSSRTPPTPPSTRWARLSRPSRFSSLRITRIRVGVFLLFLVLLVLARSLPALHRAIPYTEDATPYSVFPPPEAHRRTDISDTFARYKFRSTCNVSSLDLHAPFSPLCTTRSTMLTAMSSGGRIGTDAPYMPRGCDMRWFSTSEICAILSRFDKVVLIGDSMLRHVIGSINILIRKDLGYGAVTDWNFSPMEKRECFCNEQFNVRACSVQGIYKTNDVVAHDPASLACKNVNVIMEEIQRLPSPDQLDSRLKPLAGGKHDAFIFGHGLWSDLDLKKTLDWLDAILAVLKPQHGLFVTPNACGKDKPDEWIITQGNKALMLFEEAVGIEAKKRGIEHLGTWNMSIQARKYDGVHLDMRGNLVKAMMVLNWLDLID